ncbi:MAG: hypothetical protein ACQSGP_08930 [Frankia sp.]
MIRAFMPAPWTSGTPGGSWSVISPCGISRAGAAGGSAERDCGHACYTHWAEPRVELVDMTWITN